MSRSRRHRLIEIEWPTFGAGGLPPRPSVAEFQSRVNAVRAAMDRLGVTPDELQRYGPAIVIDRVRPNGDLLLVWTE